jgi:hypothetical protein
MCMRVTFSRLFRAIVLLLVLTMVGHVAGASAHGALCQESPHAGHGHSSGPADGHGHHHGGAPATAIQAAHDHGDGNQDQKKPQAAIAQCHGMVGGCLGCSVASTVELPTPETNRQAVTTHVETFSPTDPGVEHRPPIVLL